MDSSHVNWVVGTVEERGQKSGEFGLVSFGSSFNVCDQTRALIEAHRILGPAGHFMCIWNHRDLSDSLQSEIEELIRGQIPEYDYGNRRVSQAEVILGSRLFGEPPYLEGRIVHRLKKSSVLEAWRSHATLQRQAGPSFPLIIDAIERLLSSIGGDDVQVPYKTVSWISRRLSRGGIDDRCVTRRRLAQHRGTLLRCGYRTRVTFQSRSRRRDCALRSKSVSPQVA